jgi:hypothetical protein
MNTTDYEKALAAAQAETEQLLSQRMTIDQRLSELKSTVNALSKLLGTSSKPAPSTHLSDQTMKQLVDHARSIGSDYKSLRDDLIKYYLNDAPSDPGITDAIRAVLMHSGTTMSLADVRKGLEAIGFDLSNYANPSAVVNNTVNRLERQREVIRIEDTRNQTVSYAWVKDGLTSPDLMTKLANLTEIFAAKGRNK